MAEDQDPAVMRAVLREHGHEVPAKGRLSAENVATYREITSNVRYLDRDQAVRDYDAGVTAGDFGRSDDPDDDPADMAETTPRGRRDTTPRGRRTRAAGGVRGMWSRAKEAGKPKKGKGGHKWVSTAEVIEDFWSQLAWAARPIPPLARILACQAPTAGILLEDAARDTFVDRVVLQPVARAQSRFQAASAMLGPPVFTTMIALWGGAETDAAGKPLADEDGGYVFDARTQPLVAGLRFSLMSWLRVGGKKAEDIIEQAEEAERLGDEADALIKFILAPPDRGQSWKESERQAQQVGRDFLQAKDRPRDERPAGPGFRGASQDDITGALETIAGSSAFRPAAATGSKS